MKKFFMLLFGHFIDISFVCEDKKRLVTVLFLECPLFTSSEMYLLQLEIRCLVSCLEIPFRMLP